MQIAYSQYHLITFRESVVNIKKTGKICFSDKESPLQAWRIPVLNRVIHYQYFLSVLCLLSVDVRVLDIPA